MRTKTKRYTVPVFYLLFVMAFAVAQFISLTRVIKKNGAEYKQLANDYAKQSEYVKKLETTSYQVFEMDKTCAEKLTQINGKTIKFIFE